MDVSGTYDATPLDRRHNFRLRLTKRQPVSTMTALKMITMAIVAAMMVAGVAGGEHMGHFVARRAILLDENFAPVAVPVPAAAPRLRRDTSYGHTPHKGYSKGRVGPVYTFVKTDYNGNFKWGVRHRAGSQYAGGYH